MHSAVAERVCDVIDHGPTVLPTTQGQGLLMLMCFFIEAQR